MASPTDDSTHTTYYLQPVVATVEKLDLKPGDVLLIGLAPGTKDDVRDAYKDAFHKAVPNNQVIVVDKNVKFTVISPSQSAEVEADLRRIAKELA